LDESVSTNGLTIELGGEVLSFAPAGDMARLATEERYLPFVSDAAPGVAFRVHDGSAPDVDLGASVFDTPRWALHRAPGQLIIAVRRPGAGVCELLMLNPEARQGDIYRLDVPWLRGYPRYVLGHPSGEVLFLNLLAGGRGVLLHASGIGDRGQGLMFCGASGAGKSTLTRLWQEHPEAIVLNDDRIIVRKRAGRFWIYGTPWHGDVPAVSPRSFPLERIFIVGHAPDNSVTQLGPAEAVTNLLARSFPPFWDAQGMVFTLAFLDELAQAVPCYTLGFVPDQSAVELVRCVR
jgi:hypothetical protein